MKRSYRNVPKVSNDQFAMTAISLIRAKILFARNEEYSLDVRLKEICDAIKWNAAAGFPNKAHNAIDLLLGTMFRDLA